MNAELQPVNPLTSGILNSDFFNSCGNVATVNTISGVIAMTIVHEPLCGMHWIRDYCKRHDIHLIINLADGRVDRGDYYA
jgi:dTDP-D-glucose 4,6-dehydratase